MKRIFTFLVFAWSVHTAMTQTINWQKTYGGSAHEYCWKTISTLDGGYAFVGFSDSNDGDVLSENHGGTDLWVAKTNSVGIIQWSHLYGGTGDEEGFDILQTLDFGFMVVGYANSTDGDVTGHHGTVGTEDMWVLKVNSLGTLLWNKCYGGSSADEASCIVQNQSGDFYVSGTTYSNDGDVSGNHTNNISDFWVIKINSSGTLLNQKCVGGTSSEECYRMRLTSDNGCILAGRTSSSDGDAIGYHGGSDMLIAKLNSGFTIDWSKCYGGTETEECNDIVQLADGSYVVLGYTSTHNNGDVSGHHGAQGSDDFWLLKLTSLGAITWAKCFGGDGDDQANGLVKTQDGGFVMCGLTNSTNGDVSGFHSGGFFEPDVWVAKVDAAGTPLWQRCCGGSGQDESFNVIEANANHYIVTGFTYSADYDITLNRGSADGWVFYLAGSTSIEEMTANSISVYPNPFIDELWIETTVNFETTDKITLYDIYGSVIMAMQPKQQFTQKISTAGLSAGVYYIEIASQKGNVIKKVVKQ
ncbi:MAG: T9SS type A sorting domain-containing protein [Bacteroidota bacterium]